MELTVHDEAKGNEESQEEENRNQSWKYAGSTGNCEEIKLLYHSDSDQVKYWDLFAKNKKDLPLQQIFN